MKRLALLFLSTILLFASSEGYAQLSGDDGMPQMMDHRPMRGRLKLNDEQKKQAEQMQIDMQKQLVGVRSRAQMARLDLRQLVNADKPDKAAIEKKMNEITQIRSQAASIRLNYWFEMNKILNPEQQKVWREVLKHPLRVRMRAWMGRRHGRGEAPKGPRPFMGERPNRGVLDPETREFLRQELMERLTPEKK